jgi:RNA polymerase sigma-70 factor (ECF subfamily)
MGLFVGEDETAAVAHRAFGREPLMTVAIADVRRREVIDDDADVDGRDVVDRLVPLVYGQLRHLAHAYLARERHAQTLVTTELVHEAYLKLVDHAHVSHRSRSYFFGAAARAMRQVLVDRARHRTRLKRGGGHDAVELDADLLAVNELAAEILDLHRALERLEQVDPRAARVVECRFFAGLDEEETAEALNLSSRTVRRDWTAAKAWLCRTLRSPEKAQHATT